MSRSFSLIGSCCLFLLAGCGTEQRLCKANLKGKVGGNTEFGAFEAIARDEYATAFERYMRPMGGTRPGNSVAEQLEKPPYQGATFYKYHLQGLNYYKVMVRQTRYCLVGNGKCDCAVVLQDQSLDEVRP